jgi:peptide/nickel transport system permease protein
MTDPAKQGASSGQDYAFQIGRGVTTGATGLAEPKRTANAGTTMALQGKAKDKVVTARELAWRKFKRHRLGMVSAGVLLVVYLVCAFAEFFAPYLPEESSAYVYLPPQRVHFFDTEGNFHLRPFVYGLIKEVDLESLQVVYTENLAESYSIRFFVQRPRAIAGPGLQQERLVLFGVDEGGTIFLLGTDYRGRDLLTRILHGGRVTLSVGLFGVFLSGVLGTVLGTASGYFGGAIDTMIQRVIEVLSSIPTLPLWLALAAILPPTWPSTRVYWGIVTILALIGWTGLGRQIRAKALSVRERNFVMAARASGAGHRRIMFQHITPNVVSHIIVIVTLALPEMILAESSLSFLGLGIKPPLASWGSLLQDAQSLHVIRIAPWIMLPGVFIAITILCFNFLGDGLRDAMDPYN